MESIKAKTGATEPTAGLLQRRKTDSSCSESQQIQDPAHLVFTLIISIFWKESCQGPSRSRPRFVVLLFLADGFEHQMRSGISLIRRVLNRIYPWVMRDLILRTSSSVFCLRRSSRFLFPAALTAPRVFLSKTGVFDTCRTSATRSDTIFC